MAIALMVQFYDEIFFSSLFSLIFSLCWYPHNIRQTYRPFSLQSSKLFVHLYKEIKANKHTIYTLPSGGKETPYGNVARRINYLVPTTTKYILV